MYVAYKETKRQKTQASKENFVNSNTYIQKKISNDGVELKCKVIFSQFHITFAIGNLLIG